MESLSLRKVIESRNYTYLQSYLANELNIYKRDADGCTLLQIALQIDDIEMVRFLLEHKADPNQPYLRGTWDTCPLHFTLAVRSSAMSILLIEYGAHIVTMHSKEIPTIFIAILYNRLRVFYYLMDKGISPDTLWRDEYSILTQAASKGKINAVKCILKHRPNIELPQHKHVITAAILSNVDYSNRLVKMLYKYGFTLEPSDINSNLILAAINNGCYEAVRNMLELGVSPNFEIIYDQETKESETILHIAVETEQLKIVQLLLEYGANIHSRSFNGRTPILIAAGTNNLCIIKLLLKYGANVTDVDSDNYTVFHFALQAEEENFYKTLNLRGNRTKTKIIKFFISKGADINLKNHNDSCSPLHVAAWTGVTGAVKVLLAHGAQIDEANFLEMTPLTMAQVHMAHLIDGLRIINHREDFRKLIFSSLKLLEQHVHRLHRIGLPICPKDLEEVDDDIYTLDDAVSKTIDDEIKFIKETKIGNSHITLFRFLTSTDKEAAGFVRNEVFLKNLKAMLHLPKKFPEYVKLIRNKLTVALTKKKLDKNTFRLINFFIEEKKVPSLPDECIEHIISFLSDKDKEVVISQFAR